MGPEVKRIMEVGDKLTEEENYGLELKFLF